MIVLDLFFSLEESRVGWGVGGGRDAGTRHYIILILKNIYIRVGWKCIWMKCTEGASTRIQKTENRRFKGRSTTRGSSSGASCFSVRALSSYGYLGEDGRRGKRRLRNTHQRSTGSLWAHKRASKLSPRGVWSPLRALFVSEPCDSRWETDTKAEPLARFND